MGKKKKGGKGKKGKKGGGGAKDVPVATMEMVLQQMIETKQSELEETMATLETLTKATANEAKRLKKVRKGVFEHIDKAVKEDQRTKYEMGKMLVKRRKSDMQRETGDATHSDSARIRHKRLKQLEQEEVGAVATMEETKKGYDQFVHDLEELERYEKNGQYRDAEKIVELKDNLEQLRMLREREIEGVWRQTETNKTHIKNFGKRTEQTMQYMAAKNAQPKSPSNQDALSDHALLTTEVELQEKAVEKLLKQVKVLRERAKRADKDLLEEELDYERWATFSYLREASSDMLPPMPGSVAAGVSKPSSSCSSTPKLPTVSRPTRRYELNVL